MIQECRKGFQVVSPPNAFFCAIQYYTLLHFCFWHFFNTLSCIKSFSHIPWVYLGGFIQCVLRRRKLCFSDRRKSHATAKWLSYFAFYVGCACKFQSHTKCMPAPICGTCRLDLHDFRQPTSFCLKALLSHMPWGYLGALAPNVLSGIGSYVLLAPWGYLGALAPNVLSGIGSYASAYAVRLLYRITLWFDKQ